MNGASVLSFLLLSLQYLTISCMGWERDQYTMSSRGLSHYSEHRPSLVRWHMTSPAPTHRHTLLGRRPRSIQPICESRLVQHTPVLRQDFACYRRDPLLRASSLLRRPSERRGVPVFEFNVGVSNSQGASNLTNASTNKKSSLDNWNLSNA